MGSIYHPMTKGRTRPLPEGVTRCQHEGHGTPPECPGCGAEFSPTWWIQFCKDGRVYRQPTEARNETKAKKLLVIAEGKAQAGETPAPTAGRSNWKAAVDALQKFYEAKGNTRRWDEIQPNLERLADFFGKTRLGKIRSQDIDDYITTQRGGGLKNGTIRNDLLVFGKLMRVAKRNELVGAIPDFDKPTPAPKRTDTLTQEQYLSVRRHMPERTVLAVDLGMGYGWRSESEVLALTIESIDWKGERLILEEGTTKNGEGRSVPLRWDLIPHLRKHMDRIKKVLGRTSGPLFVHLDGKAKGEPIQYKVFWRDWHSACVAAGVWQERGECRGCGTILKGARCRKPECVEGEYTKLFHDLRRTVRTGMAAANIEPTIGKSITGHRSDTYDAYSNPGDSLQREGMRKLEKTVPLAEI